MSVKQTILRWEPRTLREAYDNVPRCPRSDATPAEQAAFYDARADAFARVATLDRDHHYEALAVSGFSRDQAREIRAHLARQRDGNTPRPGS